MFKCPICEKNFLGENESTMLDPKNDEIAEHILKEHVTNPLNLEFIKWLVDIDDGLIRLDDAITEIEDDVYADKEENHYFDLPEDFEEN